MSGRCSTAKESSTWRTLDLLMQKTPVTASWSGPTIPCLMGNGTINNEHFVADNCQFWQFQGCRGPPVGRRFSLNLNCVRLMHYPLRVKLVNSSFDGAGQANYGVVGCYGSLLIQDCTFSGYKGTVATGITAANDGFNGPSNPPYGESKSALFYNGDSQRCTCGGYPDQRSIDCQGERQYRNR